MLSFRRPDPLRQINFLSQFTLSRISPGGRAATLPDIPSLIEEIVFLSALFTDLGVLRLHIAIKVSFGGFFQKVLFGRKVGNLGVDSEHYLFPLGTLHVVIFVDPAILILLLVSGVSAVVAAITATASLATPALLALLHRTIIAVAVDPLRRIRCLSRSLRSSLLLGLIVLVVGVLFTATATSPTGGLGPGIATISRIIFLTASGFVLGSAPSAELLGFLLDFRH